MMPTIHQAAQKLRRRETTALQLVDDCLARIDACEEKVRAWVFVDRAGARSEAQRLDAELQRGLDRGPLHGIPLGIKDIYDVFDWPTAAGSRLWAQSIARRDATVVRKLREAGAIFLGKTVTTQYASFDPPPTRNPWNLQRTPGGSSSGSAAAVACGMCLGALGSQTGGSITRPASFCGVAGCKPTYGRASVTGVVPLAGSMDHPGPIARDVRDLAILLQAIAGHDPEDVSSAQAWVPDYVAALGQELPPRMGLVGGLFEQLADADMRTLMDDAAARLQGQGAAIIPVALPASFAEVLQRHRIVMAVESASFHEQRLKRHPEDYGPNIRVLLEDGLRCSAAEYARTREHQERLKREMAEVFEEVDVLLTPATRGAAPDAATTGDPAFNSPWSYTGLPTVSLLAGWSGEGMPLAIQLVGAAWQEDVVLDAAAWCESTLQVERREPGLEHSAR